MRGQGELFLLVIYYLWMMEFVTDQLQRFPAAFLLAMGVRDGIRLPLPPGPVLVLAPALTNNDCFIPPAALPGKINTPTNAILKFTIKREIHQTPTPMNTARIPDDGTINRKCL